jgi:hypothetical protein
MSKQDGRASNGGARPGAGRLPVRAEIREGDGVMVSQVYPDGGYVDLGRGKAQITRHGHSRLIVLPQPDGTEIRILIPR